MNEILTLFSFLPTDTVELENGPGHGHTGGGGWVIIQSASSYLQEEEKESAYRGDRMEKMTNADEKHAKQIFLWMVEGNTLVFPSDIWIYYDRKIRWEVTDTRMKPFNDSLVMNVWGDMKQLRRRMTIRLVVRILLYKSLQLLEMNERFNSGEERYCKGKGC